MTCPSFYLHRRVGLEAVPAIQTFHHGTRTGIQKFTADQAIISCIIPNDAPYRQTGLEVVEPGPKAWIKVILRQDRVRGEDYPLVRVKNGLGACDAARPNRAPVGVSQPHRHCIWLYRQGCSMSERKSGCGVRVIQTETKQVAKSQSYPWWGRQRRPEVRPAHSV